MAYRACQFNVSHAFPTYFGTGYFDSTLITDNSFVADFLVLAAVAFKVLGRTKYSLAEKAVSFRFQRTIVYGLWLGYLAIGPASNLLR